MSSIPRAAITTLWRIDSKTGSANDDAGFADTWLPDQMDSLMGGATPRLCYTAVRDRSPGTSLPLSDARRQTGMGELLISTARQSLRRNTQTPDPLATVLRYHTETKHDYDRFARSLGFLDWANQPDPFRRYRGSRLLPLPVLQPNETPVSPCYEAIYETAGVSVQPVSLRSLSRFLEYSLALTAWKQAGAARWALRSNPSSGNLHPTEGYLYVGPVPEVTDIPRLYHYAPKEHALEERAESTEVVSSRLMRGFPPNAFLVGLSSVHWREAWKYGERAFRYCQHDVGHAVGAVRLAAAALGWRMLLLDGVPDATIATLLGLDREADFEGAEREHPDCLLVVYPAGKTNPGRDDNWQIPLSLDPAAVLEQRGQLWHGRANRLSRDNPVPWGIIDEVSVASWKTSDDRTAVQFFPGALRSETSVAPEADETEALPREPGGPTAGDIFRQRRSAVSFDPRTSIPASRLFEVLERTMPRAGQAVTRRPVPWDAIPWDPAVHLALFVHRVEGLRPGLYVLVRDGSREQVLRQAMHDRFLWQKVEGSPPGLPLYLLQEMDVRHLAIRVSCGQDIAGDSCFSLGMIADFEGRLRRHGAWFYRRLFWETGVIGQVLYLEAEAAGVRGTGIGCFFDDPVHQVFGLKGFAFQSLYHFTVGGPVEDPRLTTLPPYPP